MKQLVIPIQVIFLFFIGFNSGYSQLLSLKIIDTYDDTRSAIGLTNPYSDDISIGYYLNQASNAGFRFQNVLFPEGAIIDSAFLQLTSENHDLSPEFIHTRIYGEASGNAAAYMLISNYDLVNRPPTTAEVAWPIPVWVAANTRGPSQRTPDIKSIIEEITQRADWENGNPVNIIIRPLEVPENDSDRSLHAYDSGIPDYYPELQIYYHLTTSSVSSIKEETDVLVFPNPAAEILYMQLPKDFEPMGVEVYNYLGQKVIDHTPGISNPMRLDIADLPDGWYHTVIRGDSGDWMKTTPWLKY